MTLFKYLLTFILSFSLLACSDDEESQELGSDSVAYTSTNSIASSFGWLKHSNDYDLSQLLEIGPGLLNGQQWEVKGKTANYPKLAKDGFVNFSIVFPALDKTKLHEFNSSSILSPEVDIISAAGQSIPIPSNVSIPKQREKYNFFITLTLNKPIYRSFVAFNQSYEMTATHGRFPFTKVIDEMRSGKNLFDVINHIEFLSGGSKVSLVSADVDKQDINIDQWAMSSKINYVAPNFDKNENAVVTVSMVERNGLLFPTDIKNLAPNTSTELNTTPDDPSKFILAAKIPQLKTDEDADEGNENGKDDPEVISLKKAQDIDFTKMSLSLRPNKGNNTPLFLDYIEKPEVHSDHLLINTPIAPATLKAESTQAILVEIQRVKHGKYHSEKRIPLWSTTVNKWVSRIDTSSMTLPMDPKKVYRWEVIFTAKENSSPIISHITRNYTEL